jgi:hypothetical protein
MMYFGLSKRQIEILLMIIKLDFVFCAILLSLLSPKYNVFCSENLQNDRVQRYLCRSIFSKFSEMFIFKFLKL